MKNKFTPSSRSAWECIGSIEIRGRLSLSDTSYFYDDPVILDVDPGVYRINAVFGDFQGFRHLMAIRVINAEDVLLGGVVGNIGVDFGQIGICDRSAVEAAFDVLGDAGMGEYFDQLNTTELIGIVGLPLGVAMYIFRPGFGDGDYPVIELFDLNGKRSGVQIDCVSGIE